MGSIQETNKTVILSNISEFGIVSGRTVDVRSRIVIGIQDKIVTKRLLGNPQLTLQTSIVNVMSADLTQAKLKAIKVGQKIPPVFIQHFRSGMNDNSSSNNLKPPK